MKAIVVTLHRKLERERRKIQNGGGSLLSPNRRDFNLPSSQLKFGDMLEKYENAWNE